MKRFTFINTDINVPYQSPIIDKVANELNDELIKIIQESDIEIDKKQELLDRLNSIDELNELREFAKSDAIRELIKEEEINGETI